MDRQAESFAGRCTSNAHTTFQHRRNFDEVNAMTGNFQSYMTYDSTAQELSEGRYNLTIGATLTWGFFLDFLLLRFVAPSIVQAIYASPGRYSGIMIGILIGYFVLVMIGSSMVRSHDTAKCLVGYHLIAIPVGLVASIATVGYDPALITRAVLTTAIATLTMMLASMVFPQAFTRMRSGLSIALLAVILVEAVSMLFFRTYVTVLDWVVVGIMCLYIGYDWVRANSVQRTTTNAIAAASALYLDIINIFLRILRILARSRNRD